MFTVLAQAQPAAQEQSPWMFIGLIAMLFVLMWFLMIRPQRKQEQKRRQMIDKIARNDRILFCGGIIGIVTNVKDDEFTVRVDDARDVKMRISRNAVNMALAGEEKKEGAE